jgi:TRAP-type mannitol/chloroaromatic compound transport system permease small subunit
MIGVLRAVERGCARIGRAAAWTVPLLVIGVCVGVVMALLRVNELASWGTRLPLLGERLSLNGLNDLQWHLFAVMVMLGGVYTLHEDRHVSVDFIASRLSARVRGWITLVCDLALLVPFCAVMTWFSWRYAASAFASGEGSSYGGLQDLWIIKAVMPLGFGLLTVFGVARALRLLLQLLGGSPLDRPGDRPAAPAQGDGR